MPTLCRSPIPSDIPMPTHTVAQYQRRLLHRLQLRFGTDSVKQEWRALEGVEATYGPRLDLAVGPFASGQSKLHTEYKALHEQHRAFISELWSAHASNVGTIALQGQSPDALWNSNINARCFLAIEIENCVSRKHLLGGALNASALGRIAVLVGWTRDKLDALLRLRSYFAFLASVGKPTFGTGNLLVLSPDQLAWAVGAERTA